MLPLIPTILTIAQLVLHTVLLLHIIPLPLPNLRMLVITSLQTWLLRLTQKLAYAQIRPHKLDVVLYRPLTHSYWIRGAVRIYLNIMAC